MPRRTTWTVELLSPLNSVAQSTSHIALLVAKQMLQALVSHGH